MKKKALLASLLAIGTLVLAGCGEEASETSEVAEESETSETVESTDSTESTESTESTDPIDSTDSTDDNDDDDTDDNDDDTDDNDDDDTGDVEYEDGTVTLVTDDSELAAGDQLILTYRSSAAAFGEQSGTYRATTFIDGLTEETTEFIYDGTAFIVTLEAGETEGSFALAVSDGYLYYQGSGNSLSTQDTPADWTISVDEEAKATIVPVEYTERSIRWNYNNGNNPRFACYASATTSVPLIEIFKARTYIEEAEPEEVTVNDTYVTDIVDDEYKFGLYNGLSSISDFMFFTGETSGSYWASTTSYDEGVSIAVTVSESGYTLQLQGGSYSGQYFATSSANTYLTTQEAPFYWSLDADTLAFYAAAGSSSYDYFIGTTGSYGTFGLYSVYNYLGSNSHYIARLYTTQPTIG